MSPSDFLERDKEVIVQTLYFCEETSWDQLRRWLRPRLDQRRFYDAITELIREESIVVEKVRRNGRRPIQLVRLRETKEKYT